MTVGGIQPAAAPGSSMRARRLQPAPVSPAPVGLTPLDAPGTAAGPWPVDHVRAAHDARQVLAAVDFNRRDLVIWVPGTNRNVIDPGFEAAVRSAWQSGGVSLARLEYEASARVRPSVATGIETLRLVLAGIAAHGGNHNVMLAGQDQGAWVIGEALADPRLTGVVTRAVLFGHPVFATHQYAAGQDPRVQVVRHGNDPWAMPTGNPTGTLDAMQAALGGGLSALGGFARLLVSDPGRAAAIALSRVRVTELLKDPTNYTQDMTRAIEFLRYGSEGAQGAAPGLRSA